MMRTSMPAASPELDQLVAELLKEESDFERHNGRSVHRETIVRSVAIEIRRPTEQTLTAFSRNISGLGVGLITQTKIPDGATALLKIEGLRTTPSPILSECRWCKAYGDNWFLSGWQFMMLKR
ncbi:MAG: hypothetical protein WBD20_06765 [Pirellulaceae bacterium]